MAPKEDEETANKAEALYMAVAQRSVEEETGTRSKVFMQHELEALAGAESPDELMRLIQRLTNQGLFRTMRVGTRLGWTSRPREAARQLLRLDREEKMVYEVVEEAYTTGVWLKDIKRRANLAPAVVQKAIQKMEKSLLIKSVTAVGKPLQKTFMLAHLTPSEDVTGNSFFDSGDLDEAFRDELLNLIILLVRQDTWQEVKRSKSHKHNPSSPVLVASDLDAVNKKRKRTSDIEDLAPPTKHRSFNFNPETDFTQLVFKAGTHHYPTAEEVLEMVRKTEVFKAKANLNVDEIQLCLDVLCWDGKLEKMPGNNGTETGYRTVRGVLPHRSTEQALDFDLHAGTGLTQAPCGRCPVFDLCREDGPVNPQECVYFDEWLK